jgi:hypothetical protein
MEQQTTIKTKHLQFRNDETTFGVQIKYDTSLFSEGNKSFWRTKLYQVDDEKLTIPLTYKYVQSRGWLLQIPKYKKHSYICSTRRKEFEDRTNLYPIVKEQIAYQWFNRKAINKYEAQIKHFNFLIEQKYQYKLIPLKEQKRELKQRLKLNEIDNKQYQKLYTPIRKQIDKIDFDIWDICRNYRNRYFECDRLKQIYRVS